MLSRIIMGIPGSIKSPIESLCRLHKIPKKKDTDNSSLVSGSMGLDVLDGSEETLNTLYPGDDLFFNTVPAEVYQSVKPPLALLRAYECKVYYEYEFDSRSSAVWHISLQDRMDEEFVVQSLVLSGSSMVFKGDEFGALQVDLLNELWNANIEMASDNETSLSFDNGQIILNCNDIGIKKRLEKLQLLSIFEYISICKALTGLVISNVGIRMPDMHLILSSAFNFKDWCEVYLDGQGWVKLWCYIKRVKKKFQGRSKHRIEFYRDDKCNELVCYIPETEFFEDVFFCSEKKKNFPKYCEMSPKSFLDSFTAIKILGNVCYASKSRNVLHSPHSMTFSLKTKASFVSLITATTLRKRTIDGLVDDDDTPSAESNFSPEDTSINDSTQFTTCSRGLLIRPLVHEGLGRLESMIRFIIPMMDCGRKYGRPGCFEKDKCNPESLMFGLPRLPSVDYFALEEMERVLEGQLPENSSETTVLAMSHFVSLLHDCIQKNPQRISQFCFHQLGSVLGTHTNGENDEVILQSGNKSNEEFLSSCSNGIKLA